MEPFFTNDAIVFGLLLGVLALVFITSASKHPFFEKFYKYVPPLLLCYFLPALLNYPLGLISGEKSHLYTVAKDYFLPASLIFLCLSIDLKSVINLGPKALIMFFTATIGVILGGPVAMFIVMKFAPGLIPVTPEELWKGMSTIAGSWIGGGGNQTAMKEIYQVSDSLFGTMVIVDVVVANIWMGFLLYGANISNKLDLKLKADNSSIESLKQKMEHFRSSILKIPTTTETFALMAVGFGGVAISHWLAANITPWMKSQKATLDSLRLSGFDSPFFWIILIATTFGLLISFTKLRKLEGVGASRWGSVFIYLLVATIGMKMNLAEVFQNLGLFAVGLIWMLIHVTLLIIVAKLIKAPFFFVAVGSQANIGGAASAPVVASAFSPALAPVGALLAVLGYALGTYGALICAFLMQGIAG